MVKSTSFFDLNATNDFVEESGEIGEGGASRRFEVLDETK